MFTVNGVQMVTFEWEIQCAITRRRLIVTRKLRKEKGMSVSQVHLTVNTSNRKWCTARMPHENLMQQNVRVRFKHVRT